MKAGGSRGVSWRPAVVGYDLASVKNQQLSSYPRSDYFLQVAVGKARLGLGYVCSWREILGMVFEILALKIGVFEIFALKKSGFLRFVLKHWLSGNGGSGVKSVTLRCYEVELCVH